MVLVHQARGAGAGGVERLLRAAVIRQTPRVRRTVAHAVRLGKR